MRICIPKVPILDGEDVADLVIDIDLSTKTIDVVTGRVRKVSSGMDVCSVMRGGNKTFTIPSSIHTQKLNGE